jgi:hypothetical protein
MLGKRSIIGSFSLEKQIALYNDDRRKQCRSKSLGDTIGKSK